MKSFENSTNASIENLNACVNDLMDVVSHLIDKTTEQGRKIENLEKQLNSMYFEVKMPTFIK